MLCKACTHFTQTIVLSRKVLCFKTIVLDQMFIDYVDVEDFAKQTSVPNNFCINKINKHLVSNNHFGDKNLWDMTIRCIENATLICP